MDFDKERITALTWKYLRGDVTAEEQMELDAWLNASPINKQRFDERMKEENYLAILGDWQQARVDKAKAKEKIDFTKFDDIHRKTPKIHPRRWIKVSMAAAVLVALISGWLLWKSTTKVNVSREAVTKDSTKDILPGGNRATLVLADGSRVRLDELQRGLVARQGGTNVVKEGNGHLAYEKSVGSKEVGFNTVITPRGGQYQLSLADGSRVWLNAGSSLRFPVAFAGPFREVTLEGEGYFEIATEPVHPFSVKTGKIQVAVLGTSFDIMAYQNEGEVRTSLMNGTVKVQSEAGQKILKPGQQAIVHAANGSVDVRLANVSQSKAWKDGLLEFEGADIGTVMRSVSRWWDVDVHYGADLNQHSFTGQLNKGLVVSEALQILKESGYNFKIEGRSVTVLP